MSAQAQHRQMTLSDFIRDLRTDVYGLSMVVASGMHGDEEQPSAIALIDKMLATLNRLESQATPVQNPSAAATVTKAPILCRADINGAWAFWIDDQDNPMIEVIEQIEWHDEFDELFTRCGVQVTVPAVIPGYIKTMALIARTGSDDDSGNSYPAQSPMSAPARGRYQGQGKHRMIVADLSMHSACVKICDGINDCKEVWFIGRAKATELSHHLQQIARLCDFLGIQFKIP